MVFEFVLLLLRLIAGCVLSLIPGVLCMQEISPVLSKNVASVFGPRPQVERSGAMLEGQFYRDSNVFFPRFVFRHDNHSIFCRFATAVVVRRGAAAPTIQDVEKRTTLTDAVMLCRYFHIQSNQRYSQEVAYKGCLLHSPSHWQNTRNFTASHEPVFQNSCANKLQPKHRKYQPLQSSHIC